MNPIAELQKKKRNWIHNQKCHYLLELLFPLFNSIGCPQQFFYTEEKIYYQIDGWSNVIIHINARVYTTQFVIVGRSSSTFDWIGHLSIYDVE